VTEGNVAFHHALLKFNPCCNKTLPQLGLVLDTRALAAAKLGCTNLIFVEPGAKINGQYYRDMLLMQRLLWRSAALLETCLSSSKTMRQHIVLVTQSEFLLNKTPQFISPDLNPVNYCIWGMLQERVYHISSTNPRYGQLAEASCCDMGWISAERGGLCS